MSEPPLSGRAVCFVVRDDTLTSTLLNIDHRLKGLHGRSVSFDLFLRRRQGKALLQFLRDWEGFSTIKFSTSIGSENSRSVEDSLVRTGFERRDLGVSFSTTLLGSREVGRGTRIPAS
jgi:hypothetical protein